MLHALYVEQESALEMEVAVLARLPAEFCAQLVEQFELIGWDRLEAVSPSLRDLDLVSQYELLIWLLT